MGKRKILFADDEEILRNLISEFIKVGFPNYDIESFKDGASLGNRLERISGGENRDIDLVITDYKMPGINGIDLIKQYSTKIDIPIILCTGSGEGIGKQAIEYGAVSYILKPFHIANFIEEVQKALSK